MVVAITIIATALSFGIAAAINYLINGSITRSGIMTSMIVPIILTPVIATFFFKILFKLDKVSTQLLLLSNTDELTGAHNRRYFFERLEHAFSRAQRYGSVLSVLIFDIDDFKKINDDHGHPAGDAMLRMVSDLCRKNSREGDEFARLGGDEFAFLIPGLCEQGAAEFSDRIRWILANSSIVYRGVSLHTSISVGVITWTPDIDTYETLIILADKALYEAKCAGKNQTVLVSREKIHKVSS